VGGGGGGGNDEKQQEAQARRDMILSSVLTGEAKERLARIALVKPDKAREVGDMLVSMAQRGQVSERISEERLKGMLTGIEGAKKETKIKFMRKGRRDEDVS
jgi:programmed cell death protein 5